MTDQLDHLKTALADRYTIERELGRGGMAVVYLAHDQKLNRQVALKVLRPELAASLGSERFLREIGIAAKLTHPNILGLHDCGEADGQLYYTMPFVEGESLRDRLTREKQLPLEDALQITQEVADALGQAHSMGLVHRDIKPENILLESGHAVVTDFGIARAVTEAGGEKLTETGMAVGTPAYMSPEQGSGSADVDARSDIYSLGCVLYEMLSGETPYTGPTPQAILAKKLTDPLPRVSTVRETVPAPIEAAMLKALAKVPADRFATAEKFTQALKVDVEAHSRRQRTARRIKRAAGALVVLVVAAMGGGLARVLLTGGPLEGDVTKLIAFPVEVSGATVNDEVIRGGDIATVMTGMLDGWGDMRWLDARDFLEPELRQMGAQLTVTERQRLSAARGATYFTSGRLIVGPDTARLFLELYHLSELEPITRANVAGAPQDYLMLGMQAVPSLLLALLPEDQAAELPSVVGRPAPAIQAFVQGELAFRRGRLDEAQQAYTEAFSHDTLFALAAFKAALAITWGNGFTAAQRLVDAALEGRNRLAPRDRLLVLGLKAFLAGDADSALVHLHRARDLDARRPDVWMAIAQVHRHLIPTVPFQDSLAHAALQTVHELSPDFIPAMRYLAEWSVRDGDLAAAREYLHAWQEATDAEEWARLDYRCVAESPSAIDWQSETRRSVDAVFNSARRLHIGLSQPACAEAGWRAVIQYDESPAPDWRFSATVALQSLLTAQGRSEAVQSVLDSSEFSSARWLYIVDALIDSALTRQADSVASVVRRNLWPSRVLVVLWPLAVWDVRTGQVAEARAIRDSLEEWAGAAGATSTDTLLWQSVAAHVTLAEGDTTAAIQSLQALRPAIPRPAITWQPWSSLGYDWLVLAQLLEGRGDLEDALRVATIVDAPGSAANVIFLRQNLRLRERIARQLGYHERAAKSAARLRALVDLAS